MNFGIKILLMFILMLMPSCRSQKKIIAVDTQDGKQLQITIENKENEKLLKELVELNKHYLKMYELAVKNNVNEVNPVEAEKRKQELQELAVKSKVNEVKMAELEKTLSDITSSKNENKKEENKGFWASLWDWTQDHCLEFANSLMNYDRWRHNH